MKCLQNTSRIRKLGNGAEATIRQDEELLGVEQGGLSRENGEQPPVWIENDFWEHEEMDLILLNHTNLSLVKLHINI